MTITTLTETSRERLMNVLAEALGTYLDCNCSYSGEPMACRACGYRGDADTDFLTTEDAGVRLCPKCQSEECYLLRCDGSCTHSRAKAALDELKAGAVTFPTAALEEEHPWCKWTVAFSHGSDWDTTSFALERLVGINVLLTTADGRSRPVNIKEWQHIRKEYEQSVEPCDSERQCGILFVELETENYDPIDPDVTDFAAYEDIREICVF